MNLPGVRSVQITNNIKPEGWAATLWFDDQKNVTLTCKTWEEVVPMIQAHLNQRKQPSKESA